jgi:type IV pilus assembly protein PilM
VDDKSIWKKEISFGRKPKEKAEVAEVTEELTEAKQSIWKKEISLGRKAKPAEPEVVVEESPVAEEPAPAEPVAAEPVPVPDPEPGPEETVWKREVSFSRKAETEAVAEEEPVAAGEPVAEEPVETQTWSAQPAQPPVQVAAAPEPMPPPVVHPPVPASELPPLPEEKVPFWKKDISFGGKKRDKTAKPEKPEKSAKVERAPKAPKTPKTPKERKPKEPKIKAPRGGGKGRVVGLKIGASQLAAARVANNGSAELQQVARERLSPGIVVGGELRDPEALSEALKDFFTKHKLPKRGVRLGIANNRIGVRTFEIAGITDQKQLANAIRFRAQEALPIPIDEAVLDYQVLSEGVDEEGQPTRKVLLVVAYRELIDRYVNACKKAGIGLVGIDLEAFALLRALQAPQTGAGSDPSAALVAVAIGHERSTFAVSDGRVCEFTRVLEWGGAALNVALARVLDAAPSEVEDVKHELTLTDSTLPEGLTPEQATKCVEALRKAIQTFARELVSSLQYYQNQPGSLGIGEIALTGGTAHLPGLAAELERLIGVRVRVGDPLARMKVAKRVGDPEQIGSFAVAIGLGIED